MVGRVFLDSGELSVLDVSSAGQEHPTKHRGGSTPSSAQRLFSGTGLGNRIDQGEISLVRR